MSATPHAQALRCLRLVSCPALAVVALFATALGSLSSEDCEDEDQPQSSLPLAPATRVNWDDARGDPELLPGSSGPLLLPPALWCWQRSDQQFPPAMQDLRRPCGPLPGKGGASPRAPNPC